MYLSSLVLVLLLIIINTLLHLGKLFALVFGTDGKLRTFDWVQERGCDVSRLNGRVMTQTTVTVHDVWTLTSGARGVSLPVCLSVSVDLVTPLALVCV